MATVRSTLPTSPNSGVSQETRESTEFATTETEVAKTPVVAAEVEVRAMVQSDNRQSNSPNSESSTTTTISVCQITSRPLIMGLTQLADHTWPMDVAYQPKFWK